MQKKILLASLHLAIFKVSCCLFMHLVSYFTWKGCLKTEIIQQKVLKSKLSFKKIAIFESGYFQKEK